MSRLPVGVSAGDHDGSVTLTPLRFFDPWVITLLRRLPMLFRLCCVRAVAALLAASALLFAHGVRATEGDALYDVDQALATHSPAAQKLALQAALRRVLVRVSGKRDVGTSAGMLRAFAEPHRYTTQRAFVTTPAGEVLRVRFERTAVESLLKSAGLPLWTAHRPTLVLWLLNDAPRRGISGRNSSDVLLAALRAEAQERGLPLVVPLGDAGEANAVTTAVDTKVFAPIASVSNRYGSQVALVGRMKDGAGAQAGLRSGQWWLIDPFGMQNVLLPAAPLPDQAGAAIEWAIRRVASPANARAGAGAVLGYPVVVTGVRTFEDYAGVLNSIKALEVVNDVDVTAYAGDQLDLQVRSRLPFAILARGIATARGLTVALTDTPAAAAAGTAETGTATAAAGQQIRLRWGRGE